MESERKYNFTDVEKLLNDPSFLHYCRGENRYHKAIWEKRLAENPEMQELATFAKQVFWSVHLSDADNLGHEYASFSSKLQRQELAANTSSKVKPLLSYWKPIAVAAVSILAILVSLFIYTAPNNTQLHTQIGEVRRILLPDSTVMFMNGNTLVSYQAEGFINKRTIILEKGEVFFDVKPGFESTFTVITAKGLKVEDISTAFSVRSFPEHTEELVQVQEGLVKMHTPDAKQQKLIAEGQALRYQHTQDKLIQTQADELSTSGWITGQYAIYDASLAEFAKILSAAFDVEVSFSSSSAQEYRITTLFTKAQTAQDIIANLETVYNLKINMDGKKIYIN